MTEGWVKLHRQILDNPISKKPNYAWLWTTLLLMANHKDTEFIWNKKKQVCKTGQVLTGRVQLSLQTGLSQSTVENILNYLESEQQIEQQKTTKFRLITILKWKDYQVNEQQFEQQNNNRITTERQQNDTYKNVKNEKNDKNIYIVDKSTSDKCDSVFRAFEEITGIKVVAKNEKRKSKIKKTLKTFSDTQILSAWKAMKENAWLNKQNPSGKQYLTIDYALRLEKIEDHIPPELK